MVSNYPTEFWVVAACAIPFVGIAKAGFGGGIGIIATPLIALTIPVTDAVALMLPILIVCDLFSVYHYKTRFDWQSIRVMVPGAVLGVAIGTAFFGYFMYSGRAMQIGLGVLSILFVIFQLVRGFIFGILENRCPRKVKGILMGAVSGITSTVAHAGGPPATIYLLPQKMPRDIFVGTTVIFYAVLNQMKLVAYFSLGIMHIGHLFAVILLSPLGFLGVRLGIYLSRRVSEIWFNWFVYLVLLLTGIQLLLGKSFIGLIFG